MGSADQAPPRTIWPPATTMTLDEKIRESNQGSHVGVEVKGRSGGTRAGVEEEEVEEDAILEVVVGRE